MILKNFLLVGLGASIGGILRYAISLLFKSTVFPTPTLIINVVGSFCIGLLFAYFSKQENNEESLKLFLTTGLCGGFTTFSAFSLENLQLIKTGNYLAAGFYIVLSITLGLIAVFAGYKLLI
jgi:fluoride exporter